MTDFLSAGFVDTFRQLYPDKIDAYTFWAYFNNARSKNIGWSDSLLIISHYFRFHMQKAQYFTTLTMKFILQENRLLPGIWGDQRQCLRQCDTRSDIWQRPLSDCTLHKLVNDEWYNKFTRYIFCYVILLCREIMCRLICTISNFLIPFVIKEEKKTSFWMKILIIDHSFESYGSFYCDNSRYAYNNRI